eukprot:CAMPEP_0202912072 /NCGR_PEP_ID=MMETSP1392-20130828/56772_1 /ASSEMBLY_ACC=CAM_ASM_000868 /TAXON_ID=225041 /ORGANISM="Chlamydomonas chlamydogama, Strain SAG 11-48b" /LENGTH=115 /DNA_ID=CAMNT_0049602853 /DNA_START=42 /DNA_END=390 /DNA_ORIENTATION=-
MSASATGRADKVVAEGGVTPLQQPSDGRHGPGEPVVLVQRQVQLGTDDGNDGSLRQGRAPVLAHLQNELGDVLHGPQLLFEGVQPVLKLILLAKAAPHMIVLVTLPCSAARVQQS